MTKIRKPRPGPPPDPAGNLLTALNATATTSPAWFVVIDTAVDYLLHLTALDPKKKNIYPAPAIAAAQGPKKGEPGP